MQQLVESGHTRRRKRKQYAISLRRKFYDGLVILLLLAPSLLGMLLFGGVRSWSIASLMILSFSGLILFFLRPLFAVELREFRWPIGFVAGVAVLIYAGVRIPGSSVSHLALFEFVMLANFLLVYLAWTTMAVRDRRWKYILGLVIFAVTLIAWYSLIQHMRGSRMVLNLLRPEVYEMRASGTYICPNHYGHVLEIFFCVSLALLFMKQAGFALRMLAGYALVLFTPSLLLTQSRSSWIGVSVGVVVTVLLILWKKSRRLFLISCILLPLLISGLGFTLWSVSPMVKARVDQAVRGDVRTQLWLDTFEIIKEYPVFGVGAGSYRWVYPQYKTHSFQGWCRYAHNEYIHTLAEYGAVGFGLFAIFIFYGLFRILYIYLKNNSEQTAFLTAGFLGAMAASLSHAVFDYNFHISANIHLLTLLTGMIVAGYYSSGVLKTRWLSSRGTYFYSFFGVAVSLVLMVVTIQTLVGDIYHRRGEKARVELENEAALQFYSKAVRINSGDWRSYLGMAHVYKSKSFWNYDSDEKQKAAKSSLEYYDKALQRNPLDTEILYGESKVYLSLGESDKAIDILEGITETLPNDVFYLVQMGIQLRLAGRYEEALAVFDRASRLPSDSRNVIDINRNLLRERLRVAP